MVHPRGVKGDVVTALGHRVEALADDAQQLMAGLDHAFEILARLRGQGSAVLLEQQFAVAEDRVHRGPQLMPHLDEVRGVCGHGPQGFAASRALILPSRRVRSTGLVS